MFIIILSALGAIIGGIIGMFVGAAAGPVSILDGRASQSTESSADIINSDMDRI